MATLALVLTALALVSLRPIALAIDLVDRPGGRKIHRGVVPIVGGLAMFLGLAVSLGLLKSARLPIDSITAALGMLVLVGLVDDRFGLSPWLRLAVQILVGLLLFKLSSTAVHTLGNGLGLGEISLAVPWNWVVTVALFVATVNAFNILDGIDGLAGTSAAASLLAAALAASRSGDYDVNAVSLILIGAVGGFLIFNFPTTFNRRVRCFMGDAGSTMLGAAVAWILIYLTQSGPTHAAAIKPITALWLTGLPVIELVSSFARRIASGHSPFRGDSDHIHHRLKKAGFGVRYTLLILLTLSCLLAAIGLVLDYSRVPESISLLSFVCIGTLVALLPRQLIKRSEHAATVETAEHVDQRSSV